MEFSLGSHILQTPSTLILLFCIVLTWYFSPKIQCPKWSIMLRVYLQMMLLLIQPNITCFSAKELDITEWYSPCDQLQPHTLPFSAEWKSKWVIPMFPLRGWSWQLRQGVVQKQSSIQPLIYFRPLLQTTKILWNSETIPSASKQMCSQLYHKHSYLQHTNYCCPQTDEPQDYAAIPLESRMLKTVLDIICKPILDLTCIHVL